MMESVYDETFYKAQKAESYNSANLVVPVLIQLIDPKSIVDFGCGVGTWLKSFLENGIGDVLGLEGAWALENGLEIDRSLIEIVDLTAPVKLKKAFDLAICLEVAEHLPHSASATLVESLVRAAPTVVFSAAVPGQGGTNHINEQWQDCWVAEFAKHGFRAADVIRPIIWQNPNIEFYYRQNILLFTNVDTNLVLPPHQEWTFNRVHEQAFKLKSDALEALTQIDATLNIRSGKASVRVLRYAFKGIISAIIRKIGIKS